MAINLNFNEIHPSAEKSKVKIPISDKHILHQQPARNIQNSDVRFFVRDIDKHVKPIRKRIRPKQKVGFLQTSLRASFFYLPTFLTRLSRDSTEACHILPE